METLTDTRPPRLDLNELRMFSQAQTNNKYIGVTAMSSLDRIEVIKTEVLSYYGLLWEEIITKSRKNELVVCRQVVAYFIKLNTDLVLVKIGKILGGRDHSTIMHSIQTVNDLMDSDKKFYYSIKELERKINANINLK